MIELKNIYRADEVKFANLFRSLRTALLEDFQRAHPDFQDGAEFKSVNYYNNPTGRNNQLYSKESAWKISAVKAFGTLKTETKKLYPTAYDLVESFGDNCFIGCYSIFEPNTILYRHTGTENRTAENIRIHIPLYVPDGDIGFEVEGEEVSWDDVFSFNNQKLHGGWNHTNERRLVFLIDLKRTICDLPTAPEWYPGMNDNVPFFEKTKDPNLSL
tara:strand:- start:1364 stop:2008 length:645 start_codon:yes stop_codon:yes gene_type:complete